MENNTEICLPLPDVQTNKHSRLPYFMHHSNHLIDTALFYFLQWLLSHLHAFSHYQRLLILIGGLLFPNKKGST